MTSITIRRAQETDNVLLAELGARCFYDSFAAYNTPEDMAAYLSASFSPDKQAAELAEPGSLFFIAEREGAPVGYARLKEGPPPGLATANHPIEIVRFYATKEWIGSGVGAALMQACLEEAVRRGCDLVWLDVWDQNHRAISFYRKWGFEVAGEQTFRLGSDLQHDLIMLRPLPLKDR